MNWFAYGFSADIEQDATSHVSRSSPSRRRRHPVDIIDLTGSDSEDDADPDSANDSHHTSAPRITTSSSQPRRGDARSQRKAPEALLHRRPTSPSERTPPIDLTSTGGDSSEESDSESSTPHIDLTSTCDSSEEVDSDSSNGSPPSVSYATVPISSPSSRIREQVSLVQVPGESLGDCILRLLRAVDRCFLRYEAPCEEHIRECQAPIDTSNTVVPDSNIPQPQANISEPHPADTGQHEPSSPVQDSASPPTTQTQHQVANGKQHRQAQAPITSQHSTHGGQAAQANNSQIDRDAFSQEPLMSATSTDRDQPSTTGPDPVSSPTTQQQLDGADVQQPRQAQAPITNHESTHEDQVAQAKTSQNHQAPSSTGKYPVSSPPTQQQLEGADARQPRQVQAPITNHESTHEGQAAQLHPSQPTIGVPPQGQRMPHTWTTQTGDTVICDYFLDIRVRS